MEIVNFSFEYLVEDLCTYDGSFFCGEKGDNQECRKDSLLRKDPFFQFISRVIILWARQQESTYFWNEFSFEYAKKKWMLLNHKQQF